MASIFAKTYDGQMIQLQSVDLQMSGFATNASVETLATTTEQSTSFPVDLISIIINDGHDDILINFDASVTLPGAITLHPGDEVNDFPRKCNVLYFKANSGSQAFRAWGVR